MTLWLSIDRCTDLNTPDDEHIHQCVQVALETEAVLALSDPELSIRITDRDEAALFNETYRGKLGPTNVLSFAANPPPEAKSGLLGDIVICAPLVAEEARQQGKDEQAHWAHLIVHGVLHLLGYDHQNDPDAEQMEGLETAALARLGFADPYCVDATSESAYS